MVRNYKKKTNRADIDENSVAAAINDIINKNCSYRTAAATHGVHFATLQYRMKMFLNKNKPPRDNNEDELEDDLLNEVEDNNHPLPLAVPEVRDSPKYVTRQVFSSEQEIMLEEYLIKCSKMQYGLTARQLREFAYQYATKLNIAFPSSWTENKAAGVDWSYGFMKRHPNLTFRQAENTSLARASSFNKTNVSNFFDNYDRALSKHNFAPNHIINIDESGITTVMTTPKVIAKTGTKQVGQTVSAERGQLVTFIGIVDAAGKAYPPAYVFPRVNFKDHFLVGGPKGSLGLANITGWVNSINFLEVIRHVQKLTNSSKEDPVLLLFDNHESHCNLDTILFGREHGMFFLTFPPHCSHKLQPLDVGVFAPFKAHLKESFNQWLHEHPGKTISIYNIAELSREPFEKGFSVSNIRSGFKKCGLWPKNRNVFQDDEFLPSYATDRPVPLSSVDKEPTSNQETNSTASTSAVYPLSASVSHDVPGTSQSTPNRIPETCIQQVGPLRITPESVRPYPKAGPRKVDDTGKKKKGRQPGRSRILTDTPEKDRLVQEKMEKEEKEKKKFENQKMRAEKKILKEALEELKKKRKLQSSQQENNTKRKMVKRSLIYEDSSSDVESARSGERNSVLSGDDEEVLSEEEGELTEATAENLGKNDFILVQFKTKKSIKFFVGQIEEKISSMEFQVQFLRKSGNKFTYPENKDSSVVDLHDVMAKLPQPRFIGETSRALGGLCFSVDLSTYNLG